MLARFVMFVVLAIAVLTEFDHRYCVYSQRPTQKFNEDTKKGVRFRATVKPSGTLEFFHSPQKTHKLESKLPKILLNKSVQSLLKLSDRQKVSSEKWALEYQQNLNNLLRSRNAKDYESASEELEQTVKKLNEYVEKKLHRKQRTMLRRIRTRAEFWNLGPANFLAQENPKQKEKTLSALRKNYEATMPKIVKRSWQLQSELIDELLQGQTPTAKKYVRDQLLSESDKFPSCISILLLAELVEPKTKKYDAIEIVWLPKWPLFQIDSLGNFARDQRTILRNESWPSSVMLIDKQLRSHLSFELTNVQLIEIGRFYSEFQQTRSETIKLLPRVRGKENKEALQQELKQAGERFNRLTKSEMLPEQWQELQKTGRQYLMYSYGVRFVLAKLLDKHAEMSGKPNKPIATKKEFTEIVKAFRQKIEDAEATILKSILADIPKREELLKKVGCKDVEEFFPNFERIFLDGKSVLKD